jgi:hypothetical protein
MGRRIAIDFQIKERICSEKILRMSESDRATQRRRAFLGCIFQIQTVSEYLI